MIDIYVDAAIKYWVFIPILVGIIFFSKLKSNIQSILADAKKTASIKLDSAFQDKVKKFLKKFSVDEVKKIPNSLCFASAWIIY